MQKTPTVGQRLASMLIDHFFMCLILGIILVPFILSDITAEEPRAVLFETKDWILMVMMIVIYALKDSVKGKSLAKRILKLQVIDDRSGNVASPFQCFVRNLLVPFWMIEVVVTFFNPERRLGDRLANTKVVSTQ